MVWNIISTSWNLRKSLLVTSHALYPPPYALTRSWLAMAIPWFDKSDVYARIIMDMQNPMNNAFEKVSTKFDQRRA